MKLMELNWIVVRSKLKTVNIMCCFLTGLLRPVTRHKNQLSLIYAHEIGVMHVLHEQWWQFINKETELIMDFPLFAYHFIYEWACKFLTRNEWKKVER